MTCIKKYDIRELSDKDEVVILTKENKKMTICNGLVSPLPNKYSEERISELKKIIKAEREKILSVYSGADHVNELMCGNRFNDDEDVISTMESANQEKLFEKGDSYAVRDALTNCMSRDYWYTYEKDYN